MQHCDSTCAHCAREFWSWWRSRVRAQDRDGDPAGHCNQDVAQMREQLKQSRRLSRALQMRVDFQLQALPLRTKYANRPRLRADTLPDEFFTAGLGDP